MLNDCSAPQYRFAEPALPQIVGGEYWQGPSKYNDSHPFLNISTIAQINLQMSEYDLLNLMVGDSSFNPYLPAQMMSIDNHNFRMEFGENGEGQKVAVRRQGRWELWFGLNSIISYLFSWY